MAKTKKRKARQSKLDALKAERAAAKRDLSRARAELREAEDEAARLAFERSPESEAIPLPHKKGQALQLRKETKQVPFWSQEEVLTDPTLTDAEKKALSRVHQDDPMLPIEDTSALAIASRAPAERERGQTVVGKKTTGAHVEAEGVAHTADGGNALQPLVSYVERAADVYDGDLLTVDLRTSDLRWSGPSRALQFHLGLLDQLESATRFWRANVDRRVSTAKIPPVLMQRARLRRSFMSEDLRDEEVLSRENMAYTIGDVEQELEFLRAGETHYVSSNVAQSIMLAAEQAEPEPLFPTDLPTPRGLIVLETPWFVSDWGNEEGKISIRAIGWSTTTVTKFDDDEETGVRREVEHPGVRYVCYSTSEEVTKLERLDELTKDRLRQLGAWATDMSGWSFGTAWEDNGADGKERESSSRVHSTTALVRRLLLCYFRWTWQRIVVPTHDGVTRADRRRMARAGIPEDGYIKVMKLRREVEHNKRFDRGEESDGFRFSYQFIVRGHPRRQWYPSLGPARLPDGSFNHESHRLIWIEPHASGNPFGPLVQGHDVTAAVR